MKRLLVLSAALLIAVISFAQGPQGGDRYGYTPKGKKARTAYEAGFRDGYNRAQYAAYNHGHNPQGHHRGKHKHSKHGGCGGHCHHGNRGQR